MARRCSVELLERRAMLAGDLTIDGANCDTNADGLVTPRDALLIANYLNSDRIYDVTSADVMARMVRLDANQNSIVNADDFFTVLGRLNDGPPEDSTLGSAIAGLQPEGEGELPEVALYAVIPFPGDGLREWIQAPSSNDQLSRFRVERSNAPLTEALTVKYEISAPQEPGVATPGVDYDALTGTIVIPAGESYADIFVNVINDAKVEGDEIVSLNLVEDLAYTLNYALTSDHLFITDNDYWDWDRTLNPGDGYHFEDDKSPLAGYSTGHLVVDGVSSGYYGDGNEVTVNIGMEADFDYQNWVGWPIHRELSDGGLVRFTFTEAGEIHRSDFQFSLAAKQDGELTIGVSYIADIQDTSDSLRWVKITPQAGWVVDGEITFTAKTPEILGAQLAWGTTGSGGYAFGAACPTYDFYLKVFESPDPT